MEQIIEIIDHQEQRVTSLEQQLAEQAEVINLVVGQLERMEMAFRELKDTFEAKRKDRPVNEIMAEIMTRQALAKTQDE